jgi:GNAT superfamily N-acetyltransferase
MEKPLGKEKSFDGFSFSIEWSMRQDGNTGSGITNVLHYTGKLKLVNYDTGEEKDCGEIQCTKILRSNMENDGEDFYDICDSVSSELERVAHLVRSIELDDTNRRDETERDRERARFMRMIIDRTVITAENGEFVNEVGDKWEITQGDILYVSRLRVKEEYRGMGLGLYLLDAADRQINSPMSLTLLIPFPLIYDESCADRSNLKADMKRLAAYYKRLGFGSLGWPESSSWFMARWNGYTHPNIETVCPIAWQFS